MLAFSLLLSLSLMSLKRKKIMKNISNSSKNWVPQHSSNIVSKTHDNGSIAIMHFENDDSFFILKTYAAEFWTLINGLRSVSEIEQTLIEKHHLPPARFKKDINNLLKDLKKADLIIDSKKSKSVMR